MSEDKYIGMDVHQASIVCAVHNPAGKCIARSIIETRAETASLSSSSWLVSAILRVARWLRAG